MQGRTDYHQGLNMSIILIIEKYKQPISADLSDSASPSMVGLRPLC